MARLRSSAVQKANRDHIDRYGFWSPRGEVTGNGLLYTAIYAYVLSVNGELSPSVRAKLIAVYESCELKPGLLMRTPRNEFGQEGPDDYIGVALFCVICSHPDLARRILDHGGVLGVWNNVHPGRFTLSAWLGRQRQLVAALRLAAGYSINPVDKLIYFTSLVVGSFSKSQDGYTLSWCLTKIARGWFLTLGASLWRRGRKKTLRRNLDAYFGGETALTRFLPE